MTDALRSNHRTSVDPTGERSRRTIRLFRNGDRYFVGRHIGVKPDDYRDLHEFLHDLSQTIDLPYGVRRLFTPEQGSEITDVNILEDGASYVCASFEPFLKLDYTSIAGPHPTFPLEQGKPSFPIRAFVSQADLPSYSCACTLKFSIRVSRQVSFSDYLEQNQHTIKEEEVDENTT